MNKLYIPLVLVFIFAAYIYILSQGDDIFVRGDDWVCYTKNSDHGHIRYPMYFNSFEDCRASLGDRPEPIIGHDILKHSQ